MSQEATLLEIRELEGEYEILGELGRGGMAIVYLARDRQLGRQVAIKVIHAAADVDEEVVGRQLNEARTVAQLQHPNVAAIYAVKRLSTLGLALVMQYVPGRTLERAMREDGTFSPERTEAVLTDIAAALAYAHARGVIHRDIKPDNVFLNDETGRALLSDFGIALSAEAGRQQPLTDMIVGTPAYMSPEQIDGVEIDGRSDLFSLGLVGYEMLTGVRAWVDESISDVMYRQKFELLPPLTEARPDTPDRLRVAIERALEKDRDDRWPTAAGFLGALTDDEWVPDDREAGASSTTGEAGTAGRIAAHLAARSARTPAAAAGTPLQTMLYRRDQTATPRRGLSPQRSTRRRGGRRAVVIGVALLLAIGAAAAVMARPELTRRANRGRRASADSTARVDEVTIAALRDSASRAEAEAERRAADSAAAAATSSADSSAALRAAIVRDSLMAARDSFLKAEAKRQAALPPPVVAKSASPARDTATHVVPASASTTPIHPPAAPTVVAGGTHTCALGGDGSLQCWGGNDHGQLGIGSSTRRPAPTRVNGDAAFQQVSVSIAHSCAVSKTGAAYCWGDDDYGQLGDSGSDGRLTPVRVAGGHAFRTVATGTTHTCGLTSTGEIWCWGRNLYGQLGDGSTQDKETPVRVESPSRFVLLTVGWNHSCALNTVGEAFCWGQNASGQLGDGTTIIRAVPAPVGGGLLFRAIAAGGSHTCALTTSGQAYCWGRDNAGQLATEDGKDHTLPGKVATTLIYMDITAGGVHSCALTATGEAYCWGRNSYGQLGDGTTTDRSVPVKVHGALTFSAIHASGAHTCATSGTGALYCWGNNSDGQLGDGTTTHRSEPVPVSGAR